MKEEEIKEKIRRIVSPIFENAVNSAHETNSNSRTIDLTTTLQCIKLLWRPHNYRRQTTVKRKDNSTIKKVVTTIDPTGQLQIYTQHTKLITIKNYKQNVHIQYGKNKLTAIWGQNIIRGDKETYLIEAGSIGEFEKWLNAKREEIKEQMDEALNDFIDRFNIRKEGEGIKWKRYEDWIKGEEFIDKIPREVIIHDTYFKKVYGSGIEFKTTGKEEDEEPTAHIKQYIKNRVVERFTPAIAEEIAANRELIKGVVEINKSSAEAFKGFTKGFLPIHAEHAENIKTHTAVLQEIEIGYSKFNALLQKAIYLFYAVLLIVTLIIIRSFI